jgi:hypothetical protein
VQLVNLLLASRGKDFSHHEDAMFGILYSTKIVQCEEGGTGEQGNR